MSMSWNFIYLTDADRAVVLVNHMGRQVLLITIEKIEV